jgi:class 3 adenylate cyclase
MTLLLVEVREPNRKRLVVGVTDSLELGRDCDGLLLTDTEISRRHARLDVDGGRLVVVDLGSTNGTRVNGSAIDAPTVATEADIIQLGRTELQLLRPAADDAVPQATSIPGGQSAPRATAISGSGTEAVVRGRSDAGAARKTSIDAVAAAVGQEKSKVNRLTGGGGTITILFSDIESSTEMATSLGDTKWFAVLREHNDIVRRHLAQYEGHEVKSQGDGFMLTFPSARSAVLCTIDMQRELGVYAAEHPKTPVRVRMGLHTGEAIVDAGGDLFGKHIIMAARIANLANGGEILASSITKEIAGTRGDLTFGEGRNVTLKGIEGEHQVFPVVWNAYAGGGAAPTASQNEPSS